MCFECGDHDQLETISYYIWVGLDDTVTRIDEGDALDIAFWKYEFPLNRKRIANTTIHGASDDDGDTF